MTARDLGLPEGINWRSFFHCAQCKRTVQRIASVQADGFHAWRFELACHGQRESVLVTLSTLEDKRSVQVFNTKPDPAKTEPPYRPRARIPAKFRKYT